MKSISMSFVMVMLLSVFVSINTFARVNDVPLAGYKFALLTSDSTHDQEALMPVAYLEALGAEVTIISNYIGQINCYNSAISFYTEKLVKDCSVDDFDALVIPGGYAPAKLRTDAGVVKFVADFAASGKLVAAVCHGPQLLVAAGLLSGKEATCVHLMTEEFEKANITFVNQEVVITDNIITGKNPRSVSEWVVAIKDYMLK